MSEPINGIPPSAPAEFVELVDRLNESAKSSGDRLAVRLRQALSRHDLNRQELLAAQRDVTRLRKIGALPGPTEYWRRSALPRAALMVDESMTAVVEEGQALGEALDRFMVELESPVLASWTGSSLDPAVVDAMTSQAIGYLLSAVPSARSIDALGSWWQRRLHRAAIVSALPELLHSSSDADLVIGRAEMSLLDRPPWSHGDRLLSAFELAHGEIKTQSDLVADGLSSRVAARGRRYLTPGRRVTIELRH
ncbi:MAG: hypothetical protein ACR2QK_09960 [Acidimicrobiales bacterium]